MRPRILLLAAALLALGAAPARAQAAPDTAGLARAVGAVLADSVIPRLVLRDPVYLLPPETPFDSAAAALLDPVRGVKRGDLPESGEAIGTRGFTLHGDTATVAVESRSWVPPSKGLITLYVETNHYLFVPGPSGWRFVRRQFIQGADFGAVRG